MIALARVALVEITPPDTFTDVAQVTRKEGVVDVAYPCTLAGYPGWTWTITLSDLPGIDPSVLELELLAGDGALLSLPWVPWADRLEDYLVAEKELDQAKTEDHDSSDDSDDEDEDDDFYGDVDGIDIYQLDLDLDPEPLKFPVNPMTCLIMSIWISSKHPSSTILSPKIQSARNLSAINLGAINLGAEISVPRPAG